MVRRSAVDQKAKGASAQTNGRNGQSAPGAAKPRDRYRAGQTLTREEMRKRLGLTEEEIAAAVVPK